MIKNKFDLPSLSLCARMDRKNGTNTIPSMVTAILSETIVGGK